MNASFQPFAPVTTPGVYVDGDTVPAHRAAFIRRAAEEIGAPETLRVYGNGANLAAWRDQPGWRFVDAGPGKNAADILLALDVIEAALSGGPRAFVIASADRVPASLHGAVEWTVTALFDGIVGLALGLALIPVVGLVKGGVNSNAH